MKENVAIERRFSGLQSLGFIEKSSKSCGTEKINTLQGPCMCRLYAESTTFELSFLPLNLAKTQKIDADAP